MKDMSLCLNCGDFNFSSWMFKLFFENYFTWTCWYNGVLKSHAETTANISTTNVEGNNIIFQRVYAVDVALFLASET